MDGGGNIGFVMVCMNMILSITWMTEHRKSMVIFIFTIIGVLTISLLYG